MLMLVVYQMNGWIKLDLDMLINETMEQNILEVMFQCSGCQMAKKRNLMNYLQKIFIRFYC